MCLQRRKKTIRVVGSLPEGTPKTCPFEPLPVPASPIPLTHARQRQEVDEGVPGGRRHVRLEHHRLWAPPIKQGRRMPRVTLPGSTGGREARTPPPPRVAEALVHKFLIAGGRPPSRLCAPDSVHELPLLDFVHPSSPLRQASGAWHAPVSRRRCGGTGT